MNASMGVAGLTVGFLRGWQVRSSMRMMAAANPYIRPYYRYASLC